MLASTSSMSLCRVLSHSMRASRMPTVLNVVRTAQYDAKLYVDPITDQEKLKEPLEEGDPLTYKRIKAVPPAKVPIKLRDETIDHFTSVLLRHGNRALATRIVNDTLAHIKYITFAKYIQTEDPEEKEAMELNPRVIMSVALANCKPMLSLKTVNRGGVAYQVPVPISDQTSTYRAMKWFNEIVTTTKSKKTRIELAFAHEMIAAFNNEGNVIKKKEEVHRQCEQNRAFAHYRFIKPRTTYKQ